MVLVGISVGIGVSDGTTVREAVAEAAGSGVNVTVSLAAIIGDAAGFSGLISSNEQASMAAARARQAHIHEEGVCRFIATG